MDAKTERSEKTKIDAAWVLSRLGEEATADAADLYEEDGTLKPIHEWPKIWRQGLVAGIDVEEVRAGGKTVSRVKKIKLSDRIKRLELIGKHITVGAFSEKHEHTGKDGGPIETQDLTSKEVARRIAFMLASGVKEEK